LLAVWAGVSSFLFACGCRSRSDLVEAELRTKENNLREAREELVREQAYNGALQRELVTLRGNPMVKISPEEASQTCTLKSITLGRQTGAFNDDNTPGDEALQVAVEPRDGDGHAIKAPGTLIVAALEVTPEGLKKPLCSWQIPPGAPHNVIRVNSHRPCGDIQAVGSGLLSHGPLRRRKYFGQNLRLTRATQVALSRRFPAMGRRANAQLLPVASGAPRQPQGPARGRLRLP